jgi:hypothetical protein
MHSIPLHTRFIPMQHDRCHFPCAYITTKFKSRRGTQQCATSRKVACSIPDEIIGFFNRPNPSSRTVALGPTQPLTEMSTKNIPGGK